MSTFFHSRVAERQRALRLIGAFKERSTDYKEFEVRKDIWGFQLPGALEQLFIYAGLSNKQKRQRISCILFLLTLIVFTSTIAKQPWALFLVLLILGVEWTILKRKAFLRAESFERDYTALLLSLSSGIRTGLDPLEALCQSDQLFPAGSEVALELVKLKTLIESGQQEEYAISQFGSSIDHADIKLFSTAFILARKEGSSLSHCLQRLARVTRQRQSFRRKIRAAVAMQKLSSFGIVGCTLIIGAIQVSSNPAAVKEAMNHPTGIKLISLGLSLVSIGLVWMLRMSKPKI